MSGQIGRPSKLTPETIEALCNNVKLALPYRDAARLAGIGMSTFMRWKERAKKAKTGEYRDFWDQLQEAEAEAKRFVLNRIQRAGEKDWHALAFIARTRWPEDFAEKVRTEISTPEDRPLDVNFRVTVVKPESNGHGNGSNGSGDDDD